jgi:thioredoxin
MKRIFLLIAGLAMIAACGSSTSNNGESKDQTSGTSVEQTTTVKPEILTEAQFKSKVFDFTSGQKFKYVGDKPCVVDFYADWCNPCKRLAPVMEELANEYKDKVYFYKVNTDQCQELSSYFNIEGIPAVYFIPNSGEPQTMVGLSPKEEYVKAIDEILLSNNK